MRQIANFSKASISTLTLFKFELQNSASKMARYNQTINSMGEPELRPHTCRSFVGDLHSGVPF